jgi:hypothetical protein
MQKKKFFSLVLALAMIFTMSISAFAGTSTTPANEFNATATVKMPTISVTLPTSPGALFINPMGFKLVVKDSSSSNAKAPGTAAGAADAANTDITLSDEKVISPSYPIYNSTPMDLDVYVNPVATLTGTPTALAIASDYPFATDSTKNEVFIYAQFNPENATKDPSSYVPSVTKTTFAKDTEGLLAIPAKAVKDPTKVGTIIKATGDEALGAMAMTFFGDCNSNAKLEWVDSEALTVTMTFTFKPAAPATPTTPTTP